LKAALLVAAAALLAGCSSSKDPSEAKAVSPDAVQVQTLTVAAQDWPVVYEASGTVRARASAVLSAKVMGYVREVNVHPGDRVRDGQSLVVLDSRDLEAGYRQADAALAEARGAAPEAENAVAAAQASLDLAQATFSRMKDLFAKRSISNQEYDEAAAKLKLAQAALEMARAKRAQLVSRIAQAGQAVRSAEVMLGYARITAPFDGVVTEKTVELGSLAAPGAPLVTLERAGAFRLEAPVEESKLAAIRTGQPVAVSLDALGAAVEGRVSEIVPAVDAASRAFLVKIDLPASAEIRSGMFGRARFSLGRRQAVAVPPAAVVERGQLVSVFVAGGGVARARFITLGQKTPDRVEVLSGLDPGEKLICPVPPGLADGARLQ
jgi:RND family efflux transporter MFP subunit